MQQTRLDNADLQIIRLLARDSRTSYKNLAFAVGVTPNAAKEKINKMLSNGVIRSFVARINPVIFGYEKECILIIRNIDETIKEDDIFRKVSLLGDIFAYAKQLEGAAIFVLHIRDKGKDEVAILIDLLRPAEVESIFATYKWHIIRTGY